MAILAYSDLKFQMYFFFLLALLETSTANRKFVCSLEETRNYIHRLCFYFLALTSDLIPGFS